ncbi:metal-dependent hydrolase family protein [Lacticaseibacillus manihotivorans]|uniref:Amidohydrolase n=3 Tax=Lacticaseibacillus manihotivorans TaxID=88233 RepID=A0A0R1QRW8_9LACO|nr:amidohydrolase family protein [Lacticaseibacillus manihotivorans]KRL43931.1 amidohydrolase [Lacticaseibacillus manihotivorans DSM 13343 = JCM 12514]QFQ92281.1 amidohydrolase family protein [Lacticaseibacillus manihotivorans]
MTTYYTNCNLWTGTEKATTSNAWFGVAAGKITATGTGDAPLQPEDDLVDLNGQTVIPGLINAHVHLSMDPERNNLDHRSETEVAVNAIKAARQLLAAGVTTVRDCGCAFNVDIKLKQLGKQVGEPLPTIVPSGRPMSMTGGHGDFVEGVNGESNMSYLVDSPDEMRKAVRTAIKLGADNIKVMATGGVMSPNDSIDDTALTVPEMAVAVEEAHNKHRTVAAHAQGHAGIQNALDAGVDSIEHGIYIDEHQVQSMIAHHQYLVPTLNAPVAISRYGRETLPAYMTRKNDAVRDDFFDHLKMVFKTDLNVVCGTDAGTPFNRFDRGTQEELALWVDECGATTLQAMQGATIKAAQLLKVDQQRGTLQPGHAADFLVLAKDPLTDIHALMQTDKQVFQNGSRVH